MFKKSTPLQLGEQFLLRVKYEVHTLKCTSSKKTTLDYFGHQSSLVTDKKYKVFSTLVNMSSPDFFHMWLRNNVFAEIKKHLGPLKFNSYTCSLFKNLHFG